jgi:hypothetical protein
MSRNKKFSAVLATLVIGFLSIYASTQTFNTSNQTSQQLNVTLNMQSGAQIPVSVAPGQNIPTNLNGEQVVGLAYNGQYDPAGANAVMQCAGGGTITMMWSMAGGQPVGAAGVPSLTEQS